MSIPLFTSLRGYDKSWLRADLIAGLTVWAVLVPDALAYASIAGVSPVITAVRMLHELAEDLAASHVVLAIAHEIGQVRDVIRREDERDSGIAVYPTVPAALDALDAGGR